MRTLLILFSLASALCGWVLTSHAQPDTSGLDALFTKENTARVYFYINHTDAVVKLEDSIIKPNTKKPMELPYGSYDLQAQARGHHLWRDTIVIDEPRELIRISMKRTEAFKEYQRQKTFYTINRAVTLSALPATVIAGGFVYKNYKDGVNSYEADLEYAKQQTLHFKEEYENALAKKPMREALQSYNSWKENYTTTVQRYNAFLKDARKRLMFMSGAAVISSVLLYKFFTYEKPTFTERSPVKKVSIRSFQNGFYDSGLSISFKF